MVRVVLFAWPGLVLCWGVAPPLVWLAALVCGRPHGRACCVGARPPPTLGRAVWVCGPFHGGACCAGVWPASWSAVLRCCVAPLMVGLGVLVRGPPHGEAYFVAACPPQWLCVVWCCLLSVVVVCAAWQQVSLGLRWWCLWWCFSQRHARLVLFVQCCLRRPTQGVFRWLWSAVGLRLLVCWSPVRGLFCAGARPPLWWGVLRLCVPPPPWWSVLCWCAPPMVGRAALVCGPPHGGVCCGGVRRPRWWCVVWWCLAPVVVVCWVAVAVVLFAWPGLVSCWCVALPLLGRAVFVRGLLHGGACCVCVCPAPCLPHAVVMRGLVVFGLGCRRLFAVVLFAWPGLVLCWCKAPLYHDH